MGCDIHLHIEIKINDKWEHYHHPKVSRNYRLFAMMANVRNYPEDPIEPISYPKGLPSDTSLVTNFCYAQDEIHYVPHSASYLTSDEIAVLDDRWEKYAREDFNADLEHNIFHCYLFGNSFGGFKRYEDQEVKGLQDIRFVFWFDN